MHGLARLRCAGTPGAHASSAAVAIFGVETIVFGLVALVLALADAALVVLEVLPTW